MKLRSGLLLLLCGGVSCKPDCKKSLYFQAAYMHPHSTLQLTIDNGKVEMKKVFDDGFSMEKHKRYTFLEGYCPTGDHCLVRCRINNQRDTTFSMNKDSVKGCFFVITNTGKLGVFYDYYRGGLRENGFID